MHHQPTDLAALMGSRICHDLISPLGAIANGMELLELSGMDGPEMDLIRESVNSATARIKLYRVAFGAASNGQTIGAADLAALVVPGAGERRIEIDWQVAGDMPRHQAKLTFLALMCLESALAWGGQISVARDGEGFVLHARAERMRQDQDAWARLERAHTGDAPLPKPAEMHFALLPAELAIAGRSLAVERAPDRIALRF